ncbi:serine hydrolase [Bacillus sp. FJAT-22090]|uniref:serine hydrolase domain-containing protein n=1 Tax=Bacillus sp. FJAT-22090 TaxID=1581038 RepID=UPI0011A9CEA4|nr:serine hydrolase domain-containing protein [Bacillus sp. FJAT-22090]
MQLQNINIDERIKHYNVIGLSIALVDNGQISMEQSFGLLETGTNRSITGTSLFNACSISKFLTSILVLKLTELELLDLDEDVNKKLISWKLAENEHTQQKKVTLRLLLSHQSGVMDPEGSFSEYTIAKGVPTMVDLLDGKTPYCKEPIEVKYLPGSDFRYSDAGYCIIQQLIEDVVGKPFKVVMNELIFHPLRMNNSILDMAHKLENASFSCGHHKNGELVKGSYTVYPFPAAAGLWSTPSDLALVVIELINCLRGKSKIGISESKASQLVAPQFGKDWTGLGVFLDSSKQEVEISSLGWGIGFQCMMVAYPYLEKGAVIMTNTDLGVHQLKGIIGEIYHSLQS